MGILAKIKRHAAVARGNFASMFEEVEIPPLPSAVTRLIGELNAPEPDVDKVVKLISSETGMAAKLIKTVNSPLFGLRKPATNVRHAIALLGFKHVKSIVLAYATMEGIPKPTSTLFDHEGFWVDSLLKALFARSLAKRCHLGNLEDAFTATLLNDIALPVLLTAWQEYYEPVVKQWSRSNLRLSDIEREQFGWDHAQAGAWIAHSWDLPEDMVCYIGAHVLRWEELEDLELSKTLASVSRLAALIPSVLRPDGRRTAHMIDASKNTLLLDHEMLSLCLREVEEAMEEILTLFELPLHRATTIINEVKEILEHGSD